jgi:hypothetical protein
MSKQKRFKPVVECKVKNDGMILLPIKKDLRVLYLIIGTMLILWLTLSTAFLIWYGITAYITTRPIELSGSIDCSSGKIGLDIESENNIQNYTTSYLGNNLTAFKEDMLFKHINLKGVDNLNCKATFSSKTQISDAISIAKAIYGMEVKQ